MGLTNDEVIKYLVFLNMNQLKSICDNYGIYYKIFIEKDSKEIKTNEIDHKETIINNISYYLKKKKVPQKTLYTKKIINFDNLDKVSKDDFIYYGQYKTTNKIILNLLKELTDGKFKFGAISQKIIRKVWKNNKLITYENFAKLWEKENKKGEINYPELAYNQFMKKHGSTEEWYKHKKNIMKELSEIFKFLK